MQNSSSAAQNIEKPEVSPSRAALLECLSALQSLADVEVLIREKLASDAPLLTEISGYLLDLGGKRVRPALCLMVAKALRVEPRKTELLQVAAGIELIHMATLLHDDIIDRAEVRRHKQSPLKKFGMGNTLLAGDFLLVRAFSLCAHLDRYIIDATERACVELTEGEILETPLYQAAHNLESSLTISRKKTASLFRLACESAAFLSGSPMPVVEHFASFGESVGMAFQALDDILDVVASEDLLGKTAGTDIRERKPSLINVLWLASGDPRARATLLSNGSEVPEIAEILASLKDSPVVEQARETAVSFARAAQQELESAEKALGAPLDPDARRGLLALVNYCLERME